MKIKKLRLQNFRCFEDVEIDFDEHLTCIVGVNGAGKTSILSALEVVWQWNNVSDDDIKKVKNTSFDFFRIDLEAEKNGKVLVHFVKQEKNKHIQVSRLPSPLCKDSIFFYKANRQNVAEEGQSLFSVEISSNDKNNFNAFFAWFKESLYAEYQAKENGFEYEGANQLNAVRRAIAAFLGEDIRVITDGDCLATVKDGVKLQFPFIAEGEKTVILLLADIARRLSIANPDLENPLEGEGIILIDEIEMHLHPSWQRKICGALKKTFPHCQFVITTHSPQVLGGLLPDEIRILSNFSISKPRRSKWLSSDEILCEIMNDDGKEAEGIVKLAKLSLLVEQDKFDEAKKLIDEIEKDAKAEIPATIGYKSLIDALEAENDSDK